MWADGKTMNITEVKNAQQEEKWLHRCDLYAAQSQTPEPAHCHKSVSCRGHEELHQCISTGIIFQGSFYHSIHLCPLTIDFE